MSTVVIGVISTLNLQVVGRAGPYNPPRQFDDLER